GTHACQWVTGRDLSHHETFIRGNAVRNKAFVFVLIVMASTALLVTCFFTAFPPADSGASEKFTIALNEVAAGVRDGTIRLILISGDKLQIEYADRKRANSTKETNVGITQVLRDYGVTPAQLDQVSIVVVDPPQFGNWVQFFVYSVFPWAVFIGVFLRLN